MKNIKVEIKPSCCPKAEPSGDCSTCPHFCGVGVSEITDEVKVFCGCKKQQEKNKQ